MDEITGLTDHGGMSRIKPKHINWSDPNQYKEHWKSDREARRDYAKAANLPRTEAEHLLALQDVNDRLMRMQDHLNFHISWLESLPHANIDPETRAKNEAEARDFITKYRAYMNLFRLERREITAVLGLTHLYPEDAQAEGEYPWLATNAKPSKTGFLRSNSRKKPMPNG
ncbi:hypothetical protein NS226_13630 [Aureimonas ureilytica]|uniref:Uncharacterized protein n=1 Tax=Aureimonas ureilytica TaxID=401562 RepID=A0A175R6F8_9HYPH|nr:hypothetical protein [Aureimonas ureilytica]KTQ95033.1 hypothetical protein NS226_13630 [Aureimonas ureilytica]